MTNSQLARPLNRVDRLSRPRLSAVPAPQPHPQRWVHLVFTIVAVLVVTITVSILLNGQIAVGARELAVAQKQLERRTADNEVLKTEIAKLQSAPELARRASAAGLVPAGKAGLISLTDNTLVVGVPAVKGD